MCVCRFEMHCFVFMFMRLHQLSTLSKFCRTPNQFTLPQNAVLLLLAAALVRVSAAIQ